MTKQQSPKIMRRWHGVVPEDKSEEYYRYLLETGIEDYQSIEGNCGVYVLRRNQNGYTHFLLLTLWESYKSIRKFAGDDFKRARYYPEDSEYLLKLEPEVIHYDLLLKKE